MPRTPQAWYSNRQTPLIFGHRGAAGLAPENTLRAFERAVACGVDGVEFDVQLAGDGTPVVFHDFEIGARLAQTGPVHRLAVSELKQVDVRPYHPESNDPWDERVRIPTLADVFDFFRAHPQIILNAELKTTALWNDALERAVAACIAEFDYAERVLISSFNPLSLRRFRRWAPHVLRGLNLEAQIPQYLRRGWFHRLAHPDVLHPHHALITPDWMAWATQKGFTVHTWTVNEPADVQRLSALGVKMVITDFPNLF